MVASCAHVQTGDQTPMESGPWWGVSLCTLNPGGLPVIESSVSPGEMSGQALWRDGQQGGQGQTHRRQERGIGCPQGA